MQITVTNLTSSPVYISDFYAYVLVGVDLVVDRPASSLSSLKGLQSAMAAGSVSAAFAPTSDEIASGLMGAPNSITADDCAAVADASVAAAEFTIRKVFSAGGAAAVSVYAAGALPFKFRIMDASLYVSTAAGGSTVDIQREAAADAVGMQFDTATTGKKAATAATSTALMTPGATKGLFLLRSTNAVAGEVVLSCRRES